MSDYSSLTLDPAPVLRAFPRRVSRILLQQIQSKISQIMIEDGFDLSAETRWANRWKGKWRQFSRRGEGLGA
jgi:hypothetical protein